MEQKRKHRQDPFSVQNLYYNQQEDFYVCPAGQKLRFIGHSTRASANGYTSQVSCYQAVRCEGCPMRGQCHKAQGNRVIEVNHRLTWLKTKARERLLSEQGLYDRGKRPVEVEAVFGQMKSNNRFTRFSMKGLQKVAVEFGLMAIAHNLRKWARKWKNNALIDNPDGKNSLFAIRTHLHMLKSTTYPLAA